jgi:hypothetical protein
MTDGTYDQALDGQVLKTDIKGRVWSTRAQRAALLEEFERSGLSGPKFAAVAGIKYQTFVGWRRKYRRLQASGGVQGPLSGASLPACGAPAVRWMEAVVPAGSNQSSRSQGALRVQWQGRTVLEIAEAGQVPLAAALLVALETHGRVSC